MHRERIEVLHSNLGGARFVVAMPLNRIDASVPATIDPGFDRTMLDGIVEELVSPCRAPERRSARAISRGPGARLVVEDNPDMNRFITQCLGRHYDVISAFDGREGLEKGLQCRPTVVVSDIMIPNVSGAEMIGDMRAHPVLQSTPVLLLSAKADEELRVKLLDNGAQDFVVEPFSERELLARVRPLVLAEEARSR